jgi:SAM-dependent methyltransferase
MTLWEMIASTKWGSYISEIEKRALLKAHILAARPAEALEIGCEGGRWSKLLSDLGWKMTCIDVDAKALAICQRRLPAADCILVDSQARKLPCNTGSLGLVLCIEVPHVMPDSDWFISEA